MKQFPLKQSPQQIPVPLANLLLLLLLQLALTAAIVARVCFKAQIASARQKYGQGKGNVVRMEQRSSRKTAAQHWLLAIIHENIHTKQKATGFPSHSFLFHTLSSLSLSLSNSSWKAFSSCWQLRANLLIAIFLH